MKKILRIIVTSAIAIVLCYIVFRSISWPELSASLHMVRPLDIFVAVVSVSIISFIKGVRFFFLLRFNRVKASFGKTLQVFSASQAFTPLPAGEIIRAILFKKKLGISIEQVAAPVFLQALIELWTATMWVLLGAYFIRSLWSFGLLALLLLLVALTLPFLIPRKLYRVLLVLEKKGLHYTWMENFIKVFDSFEKISAQQTGATYWKFCVLILTLGLSSHIVSGALIWYIARMEGAHLVVLQGIFLAAMGTLIQGVLSIIPGGLGVTEGGLTSILRVFGVLRGPAAIITLFYRVITLPLTMMFALIFLGSLYLPKKKRLIRHN